MSTRQVRYSARVFILLHGKLLLDCPVSVDPALLRAGPVITSVTAVPAQVAAESPPRSRTRKDEVPDPNHHTTHEKYNISKRAARAAPSTSISL